MKTCETWQVVIVATDPQFVACRRPERHDGYHLDYAEGGDGEPVLVRWFGDAKVTA